MESTSQERVRRLVRWLKAHRPQSLGSNGEPMPAWLAQEAGRSVTYWSDVLRIPSGSGKSFGDKAARELEDKLKIPQLHLEGAGWPFEGVDQGRFDALTERQKGRVEQKLKEAITAIEAERVEAISPADSVREAALRATATPRHPAVSGTLAAAAPVPSSRPRERKQGA